MLRILDLEKNYGPQTLFKNVTLNINPKQKIGLVGRNGSGKSTFLKIINQEEEQSGGEIVVSNNTIIRSLEQNLNFKQDTILKQVVSALPKSMQFEEWKAKSILLGLGFQNSDFERNPKEFSSGYQIRIRLAEALVSESDLLLLDEPTNYLDITSLRWLTRFLKNWPNSFILITHNHKFMEDVVTHTIAIHRQNIYKMKGGPSKLLNHLQQNEEIHEKTRQNQLKKQSKQEEFIRSFRAGARSAGLVQSRIKSLEKQEVKEKLQKLSQIKFNFQYEEFKGNILLQCKDLDFYYTPDKPLIKGLNITMLPGDKIAIVGPNGKGKTTLLKLLTEKLEPIQGRIVKHGKLKLAYFGSDSKDDLDPSRTILEELLKLGTAKEQKIRGVLGSLLFTGESVKKKINMLSGGEKSRVALAKVMLKSSQALILDEPTNHLDMESCEALSEALQTYEGTVIFVSHDEGIVSDLANRLIVFDQGNARVKDRSYQEFLETEGWSDEGDKFFKVDKSRAKSDDYQNRKDQQKLLRQNKKDQNKIEKQIDKLSNEQETLGLELADACHHKNHNQIKTLGEKTKKLTEQLDELYTELEKLMDEEEKLTINI